MSWILLLYSLYRWESSGIEVQELPQSHTICKCRAAAWPRCCAGRCPGIDSGAAACSSLSVPYLAPGQHWEHCAPPTPFLDQPFTPHSSLELPTEKHSAGDKGSRWFKKVIKKLCLLFGFRSLSSFRFEQWVLGGVSRLVGSLPRVGCVQHRGVI